MSLPPGQRAQPFARGVEVHAEWSLQRRHVPVVGNDHATFGDQGRVNENLIAEFRAHPFARRIPLHPQGRLAKRLQPRPRIRREIVRLLYLLQHRFVFVQNVLARYRRQQATQPRFEAAMRLVTPENARHENAGVNDRQLHHASYAAPD